MNESPRRPGAGAFASRITELREGRGVRKNGVPNISESYILKIENQGVIPSESMISKLAAGLSLSPNLVEIEKLRHELAELARKERPNRRSPQDVLVSHAEKDFVLRKQEWSLGFKAWTEIDFPELYKALVTYYDHKRVPLFRYPCSDVRVPLYVQSPWKTLTLDSLVMTRNPIERPVHLSVARSRFIALIDKVRRTLGRDPLWNDPVFRLVKLHTSESGLALHFEHGHFFNSFAYQDFIAHETRLALASTLKGEVIDFRRLKIRNSVASSTEAIESFCENQVCGIGVSNLILFQTEQGTYRPAVRQRGSLSLVVTSGILDNISSGIFDIANADSTIDLKLEYKVLKEIYEELFGKREVEREIRHLEPYFFFKADGIKELKQLIDDGGAQFRVTGFCFDLLRMAPEITTVLVVGDPNYYRDFYSQFFVNREYGRGFELKIPRNLGDVDNYLANQFPSDPARPDNGIGFDPSKWTPSGGFCFYQGLQRAAKEGLL